MLCAALVFLMQAGFLCLESGLTRNKNSINVAAKNVADFAVAALLFWLVGFGLMFGPTWSGLDRQRTVRRRSTRLPPDARLLAFLLFQVMFCATATTIVAGAVAERMRFGAYLGGLGAGVGTGLPGVRPLGLGRRLGPERAGLAGARWVSSTSPAPPSCTASAAGWRWWRCC
ncbi:MAG: hypothetical protein MZW92_76035 [Comamonadaceae bacterium]|nr:hypothetical protein [Comamonadaceae bacterium]